MSLLNVSLVSVFEAAIVAASIWQWQNSIAAGIVGFFVFTAMQAVVLYTGAAATSLSRIRALYATQNQDPMAAFNDRTKASSATKIY